jgi:hypothetical protein
MFKTKRSLSTGPTGSVGKTTDEQNTVSSKLASSIPDGVISILIKNFFFKIGGTPEAIGPGMFLQIKNEKN